MRIVLFVMLCLLAPSLCAQTIYKCRDHKGRPVYQSFPCGGTKPPEKIWDSQYHRPTNAELWQRYHAEQKIERDRQAIKARNAQNAGYQYWQPPRYTASDSRRAACAAAKSHRQSVLDRVGLNRTFDLLRNLDDNVARACK